MMMSPGGRRISWLFFNAVRAGLAVKRPYPDSYGSSPAAAGRKNSQPAAARRVALKMGRWPQNCPATLEILLLFWEESFGHFCFNSFILNGLLNLTRSVCLRASNPQ